MQEDRVQESCFLPDFCGLKAVFLVTIIAQLFAFIVVLIPVGGSLMERWLNLGMVSLFVQWCALGSSAILCILRRYMARMSHVRVATISYFVVISFVFVVSEIAYEFIYTQQYNTDTHWHFVLRNIVIAAILTGPVLRYFYIQHQWRQNVRAEAQARWQSLQSRIRPHFFFNSMNTIASLTRLKPDLAEQAVENLADLFRASLSDAQEFYTIEEELQLCRRYLDIEKLRLDERLKINWQVDALPQDALVPRLILQPLVENAINHGIELLTEGGTVQIHGEQQGNSLYITVSNPMARSVSATEKGNQIAQKNIQERLQALYGRKASLNLNEKDNEYAATIIIPYWNVINEDSFSR